MGFKFWALTLALCLMLPLSTQVQAADGDAEQAKAYVERAATEVFDILKTGKSKGKAQTKALEKMIRSNVDIAWIGQFVMGRFWRQATDAQKTAYLKNYEDFIATTYASRFTEYNGDGFTVADARDDGNDKFTVKMTIKTDKAPVLVDYKVRKSDGDKFKIYDLKVEGVSMITTQRSEFSSILQDKGIDHLIAQLGNKTDSLVLVKQK